MKDENGEAGHCITGYNTIDTRNKSLFYFGYNYYAS